MASAFRLVLLLSSIIRILTIKAASAQSENFGEAVAASVCPAPCPPGWTQFGSRCFIFYYQSRTWSDAEKFCISIGGNLASIHSLDENNFISEMVERQTGSSRDTWIGGYDAVSENTWLWSDGSAFEFTHWYTNQPDNSGSQHCLEINYGGSHWNDIQCSMGMPFVCARDI
ncbi:galactose-specific lectin nattectin-like isoform X1 [Cyprinodon tularosa]|uniref:galactose-specific lectin nattectin-like isoform X1 n=1 Tax=Cyprinodon tularosa TaxID=77115 RepID=UPI0018E1FEA8|nr:galactose-specific lectin nattectin-like isoform X1 [Cyprinodon tularosa]